MTEECGGGEEAGEGQRKRVKQRKVEEDGEDKRGGNQRINQDDGEKEVNSEELK